MSVRVGSVGAELEAARPWSVRWALLLQLLAIVGGIALSIAAAQTKNPPIDFSDPWWWWKTAGGYGLAGVVLAGLSLGHGWLRWWLLLSLLIVIPFYALLLRAGFTLMAGTKAARAEFLLIAGAPLLLMRAAAVLLLFRREAGLWFAACRAARLRPRAPADF
jgi:hypothetical protein